MPLERYNKAPFPWYGGKSRAAPLVWQLLGDVPHYVEPFAGALGVLLERPHPCNRPYFSETINDLDGFVCNAWRAIQWSPEATADAASWPVCEADKSARQIACLKWRTDAMLEQLAGDATFHDPLIAGWWLYGVCCQIGAFSGDGAWTADPVTGRIVKQARGLREPGVARALPHIGDNGQGVNRPQLREPGVARDRPHIANNGQGVNHAGLREPGVARALPHIGDNGQGVNRPQLREPGVAEPPGNEFHPITMPELIRWFRWLSARLRHVRIVNGDWARVCTTGAAHTLPVRQGEGPVGIFVDPPYANAERAKGLYGHDCGNVAADVQAWALAAGDNPRTRIVLAGFDVEHTALEEHGWTVHEWYERGFLTGGMGEQAERDRLWASPHCLPIATAAQFDLFGSLRASHPDPGRHATLDGQVKPPGALRPQSPRPAVTA
jgi:hypothetical protein